MEFFVDIFKMRVGDVSINLRGCDVAVAEHALNAAEVGTVH